MRRPTVLLTLALSAITASPSAAQSATDVVVMRRAIAAPRTVASTSQAPARALSCGAFQYGYFTGWKARRYIGNAATLDAAKALCETGGRSPEDGCTIGKVTYATPTEPLGSWNVFGEAGSVRTATSSPDFYMAFCTAR